MLKGPIKAMDKKESLISSPSQEHVAFSENSTVLIWRNSHNLSYDPHWHTAMEVIIPIENSYDVCAGTNSYHLFPHDILIIPPGEIHTLTAPDMGVRFIYLIDISFLNRIKGFASIQALMAQPVYITQASHPHIHKGILSRFLEMEEEYFADRQYCEITVYSILLDIFSKLGYERTHNENLFSDVRIYKKKEYIQKLNIVLDYIDANFADGLSLEDMADMVGYSKYHFSRLFSEYTKQTFCDYLNLRRIKAAEGLLLNDSLSVTEIAMQSGFSSIATFNRLFKSLKGCSPSEYRRLNTHIS